jgi:predicted HD phosphohydrolase
MAEVTPATPVTPVACARATTFSPIVDDGPRTAFLHTSESTTADWLTIGVAMTGHLSVLPDTVLSILRGLDALQLGYPVSMLELSLRTATRARRAGASDDLILVALCHRIGMAFTVEGYAELSAAVLRGYVADSAYRVARHHPAYSTRRSAPSDGDPTARYASQPWHADAQRFAREWADPSYDPGDDALALDDFESLVRAKLGLSLHDAYVTRTDCVGAGS